MARRHVARLERAGFAGRLTVAGQQWVVPTRAGLRFADLDFETWAPRAGTVLEAEAVYATEHGAWSGKASVTHRHRAKIDANAIRQLGVGEAVVVSRGRAARMLVIPAPAANNGLHASLPPGDPDPGRPGRSLAGRAAIWPSTASRVLRIPSGRRSSALDPPAVQLARDDASPGLGEEPARPASAPEGGGA